MHKGQRTEFITAWTDEYFPGIGTFSVKAGVVKRVLETYECDHCGRTAAVVGKATEDFFCRDCQQLISIEPAPDLQETYQ